MPGTSSRIARKPIDAPTSAPEMRKVPFWIVAPSLPRPTIRQVMRHVRMPGPVDGALQHVADHDRERALERVADVARVRERVGHEQTRRLGSDEASAAIASGPSACRIRSTTCSSSTSTGNTRRAAAHGRLRGRPSAARARHAALLERASHLRTALGDVLEPLVLVGVGAASSTAAPAPRRGDETIDQRDQRALLRRAALLTEGCTTSALLRSRSSRATPAVGEPPRLRLAAPPAQAAGDRVLGRSQARRELRRAAASRDRSGAMSRLAGDRRGDAEREDRPEPETAAHRQLRDRDEVRHRHDHGADEADHEAERADDERLSEEQSRRPPASPSDRSAARPDPWRRSGARAGWRVRS